MNERWIASVALACALFAFVAIVTAAQGQTGTVAGQVVNGTSGGKLPGPMTVTLHPFDGTQPQPQQSTPTDSEGRFQFGSLPVAAERFYVVTAEYRDIQYASVLLALESGSQRLTCTVTIYDTTDSDADVSFDRVHIILQPAGEGSLLVQEMYVMHNAGDRTYIGAEMAPGAPRLTGRYTLPVGATGVTMEDDPDRARFVVLEEAFVDTAPVPPGVGVSRVVVDYELRYSGDSILLTRQMPYTAKAVQIFLAGTELEAAGDGITFDRTMGTAEQAFNAYTGQAVARGGRLTFEVTGLAAAGVARRSTPVSALALVVVGGLLIVAAGFVIYRLARRGAPVHTPSPAAEHAESLPAQRQTLIDRLAALDDDHDAGRIPQSEYDPRRSALKGELLSVVRRQKERGQ